MEAARFAKNGWERTAGIDAGDGIEIRVAMTLLIAVPPQFVVAREAELRRAGDHGQAFQIQAVPASSSFEHTAAEPPSRPR